MLLENKYGKWYDELINKGKERIYISKGENHHIYPISIYGHNNETVMLTYREHYVAHLLLYKMFKSEFGEDDKRSRYMIRAITSFSTIKNRYNDDKIICIKNSRLFEHYREKSKIAIGKHIKHLWDNDQEFRDNLTKSNQEYWGDDDNRKEQSKKRKQYFKENPDKAKEVGEFFKEYYSDPDKKKICSDNMKENRLNPVFESNRLASLRTPEARIKNSERVKAFQNKPENRKKNSERVQAYYKSKEGIKAREKHSENIKGRKKVVNKITKEKKVVINYDKYISKGWILWTDIPKIERSKYKG
jgi:hypothetical protein